MNTELNIFLQGFVCGFFLMLAISMCFVMPYLFTLIDVYSPKRYREFLRERRQHVLERQIKRLWNENKKLKADKRGAA